MGKLLALGLIILGVALSIDSRADDYYYSCSSFKNSQRSCFMDFDGKLRQLCEVCRENRSCFLTFDNATDRGLCEAYHEGRSCFMAINDARNRGWCEHIKEGKSCFMALDEPDRDACERGLIPNEHAFWIR